jgi:hypothetical protein
MKPNPITLSLDDRRLFGSWAADSAERVLPLFQAKAPSDSRPRDAIEGSRIFARGGKRTVQLRTVALAALAAARDVGDPSAAAAARAAAAAATTAYTKALAAPHHAKHALVPAVYAALAREIAANDDPVAGDEEIRWAIDHASPAVREIVCRWPARVPGRTRLNALYYQLDAGLRTPRRRSTRSRKAAKRPPAAR